MGSCIQCLASESTLSTVREGYVTGALVVPQGPLLIGKVLTLKPECGSLTSRLSYGYDKVSLTERSKTISTFIGPDGLYQYCVIPFSLKRLPVFIKGCP